MAFRLVGCRRKSSKGQSIYCGLVAAGLASWQAVRGLFGIVCSLAVHIKVQSTVVVESIIL